MWDPESFANEMLRAVITTDSAASTLKVRTRGKKATIGIIDAGEWVPLLRLSNPSASCKVMNLDVRQGRGWASTFERGTPETLAERLRGPLRFTWAVEAEASGWSETSRQRHYIQGVLEYLGGDRNGDKIGGTDLIRIRIEWVSCPPPPSPTFPRRR